MHAEAVFAASAVERRAFADLIDGLDDAQLATPSLCTGWDVRTVAAHLASAVEPSNGAFVHALVRARGDAHRANDAVARKGTRRPVVEIADAVRRNAESRFSPPMVGFRGPLTDVLVHAGDIRIPLGLPHDPASEHLRIALDFVTGGRPIGFVPRGLLKGVRLMADDLGWSAGAGELVAGRGADLLMVACGREPVLTELRGPGVETLRGRLLAARRA